MYSVADGTHLSLAGCFLSSPSFSHVGLTRGRTKGGSAARARIEVAALGVSLDEKTTEAGVAVWGEDVESRQWQEAWNGNRFFVDVKKTELYFF